MKWIEYNKLILKKVSFDKGLLRKELEKALIQLGKKEGEMLQQWYKENFNNRDNKN